MTEEQATQVLELLAQICLGLRLLVFCAAVLVGQLCLLLYAKGRGA